MVMKIFRNTAIVLLLIGILTVVAIALAYNLMLEPVSKSKKPVEVTIKKGMRTDEIMHLLKEKKLIRSEFVAKVYSKSHELVSFKAGTYTFTENQGTRNIVKDLNDGNFSRFDDISLTFKEGINIPKIARLIAEKTNNSEEDVYNLLADEKYIDKMIKTYWFLSDDIKNENIYYPLEGYLFPDTYSFKDKDVTVEEIFEKMLKEMGNVLGEYKNEIAARNYKIHEFLSLSSLVEAEGVKKEDRKNIASVFENRLKKNMSLGSDVTTYYAIKVDVSERDLKQAELNLDNPYNTRGPNMEGKLPVGPIAISSKSAMEATLRPNITEYLYFVADKDGKNYFSKTSAEHEKTVRKLKDEGNYVW